MINSSCDLQPTVQPTRANDHPSFSLEVWGFFSPDCRSDLPLLRSQSVRLKCISSDGGGGCHSNGHASWPWPWVEQRSEVVLEAERQLQFHGCNQIRDWISLIHMHTPVMWLGVTQSVSLALNGKERNREWKEEWGQKGEWEKEGEECGQCQYKILDSWNCKGGKNYI